MDREDHRRLKTAFAQFLKFNLVGISNVLITYGIYSLVVYFTDSHRLGLFADYAFGIVYTFVLNKFFTFKRADSNRWFWEFLRILALYALVFGLNWIVLNYLVEYRLWNKYFAQAVALAAVTALSFFGQKYLVFRDGKEN